MKPYIYTVLLLITNLFSSYSQQNRYKDKTLSPEERTKDLLKLMSLEEKVAQLQSYSIDLDTLKTKVENGIGFINQQLTNKLKYVDQVRSYNNFQKFIVNHSKWGIPAIFYEEGNTGLTTNSSTSFPQPLAQAATWDLDLMKEMSMAISKEAKIRGIRQELSPVVNLARDGRRRETQMHPGEEKVSFISVSSKYSGRIHETYGEDPFLASQFGATYCKILENQGIITTPKYFIANYSNEGLNSYPIHLSERILREIYLAPFQSCIVDGKASSLMPGFNTLEGIPCSSNIWLLSDILRSEWKFKGYTISDNEALMGMIEKHRTASNEKEAASLAIQAGLNVEIPKIQVFGNPLLEAIHDGMVPLEKINEAVKPVLEAKFRTGLYDMPFLNPSDTSNQNLSDGSKQLALKVAVESIVLLKNKNSLLPLSRNIKSIAIIGPLANNKHPVNFSNPGANCVTVLEGIKNYLPETANIYFENAINDEGTPMPYINSKCFITEIKDDLIINGLIAEYFNNKNFKGAAAIMKIDSCVNFDWGKGSPAKAVKPGNFSARWIGKLTSPVSGNLRIGTCAKGMVKLYIDDKLIIEKGPKEALFTETRFEFIKDSSYSIRLEYIPVSDSAAITLEWEINPGKDIEKAISIAKKSEVAVIVVGTLDVEGKERTTFNLSDEQEVLIRKITETGIPVIVALQSGNVITMKNWVDRTNAVIEAWDASEENGNAVAGILFGKYNPGGKLPITFPLVNGDLPLYYNSRFTVDDSLYVKSTPKPIFPFGFGLSYTTFRIDSLRLSSDKIKIRKKEPVTIAVDVTNTGTVKGDEVVQLYIHDNDNYIARPMKDLKGFRRVSLSPGEKVTVTFELKPEIFSYYDKEMKKKLTPSKFDIMIGNSSDNIILKTNLRFVK